MRYKFIKALSDFYFFKYSLYLKNEEALTDEIISIKNMYQPVSQNKLVKNFYEDFNNFFGNKVDKIFFIDQRDLFERYIYLFRYKEFFKLIYKGKIKSARSGYPYLSELIAIASSHSKNFIFMPYRLFNNLKYFISLITKILLNIISLIKIISFRLFFKKQNYIVLHTSNNFYKDKGFDYRISHLVDELDKQNKKTCFFIRSRHGPLKLIKHYFKRNRISFYTDCFVHISFFFSELTQKFSIENNLNFNKANNKNFDDFLLSVVFAKHFIRVHSVNMSKQIISILFKILRCKYYIGDNSERSIMEFLAAKDNFVKTISFQNGTEFDFYMINKFINNQKAPDLNFLAHDKFYSWNSYWKNYYINKGNVYTNKDIVVKGYYRELLHSELKLTKENNNLTIQKSLPILFLIENETPVSEILDYLIEILKNGYQIVFKLRPQQKDAGDCTYEMILERISGFIQYEAQISETDLPFEKLDMSLYKLALGSYTTALIDCLINDLDVLFLHTKSWEDCFYLEQNPLVNKLFCKTPEILIQRIINFRELKDPQIQIRKIMLPICNKSLLEEAVSEMN